MSEFMDCEKLINVTKFLSLKKIQKEFAGKKIGLKNNNFVTKTHFKKIAELFLRDIINFQCKTYIFFIFSLELAQLKFLHCSSQVCS
jgi:hypothetical protein